MDCSSGGLPSSGEAPEDSRDGSIAKECQPSSTSPTKSLNRRSSQEALGGGDSGVNVERPRARTLADDMGSMTPSQSVVSTRKSPMMKRALEGFAEDIMRKRRNTASSIRQLLSRRASLSVLFTKRPDSTEEPGSSSQGQAGGATGIAVPNEKPKLARCHTITITKERSPTVPATIERRPSLGRRLRRTTSSQQRIRSMTEIPTMRTETISSCQASLPMLEPSPRKPSRDSRLSTMSTSAADIDTGKQSPSQPHLPDMDNPQPLQRRRSRPVDAQESDRTYITALQKHLVYLHLLVAERQALLADINTMLESFGVASPPVVATAKSSKDSRRSSLVSVAAEAAVSCSVAMKKCTQSSTATLNKDYTLIPGDETSRLPCGLRVTVSGQMRVSRRWRFLSTQRAEHKIHTFSPCLFKKSPTHSRRSSRVSNVNVSKDVEEEFDIISASPNSNIMVKLVSSTPDKCDDLFSATVMDISSDQGGGESTSDRGSGAVASRGDGAAGPSATPGNMAGGDGSDMATSAPSNRGKDVHGNCGSSAGADAAADGKDRDNDACTGGGADSGRPCASKVVVSSGVVDGSTAVGDSSVSSSDPGRGTDDGSRVGCIDTVNTGDAASPSTGAGGHTVTTGSDEVTTPAGTDSGGTATVCDSGAAFTKDSSSAGDTTTTAASATGDCTATVPHSVDSAAAGDGVTANFAASNATASDSTDGNSGHGGGGCRSKENNNKICANQNIRAASVDDTGAGREALARSLTTSSISANNIDEISMSRSLVGVNEEEEVSAAAMADSVRRLATRHSESGKGRATPSSSMTSLSGKPSGLRRVKSLSMRLKPSTSLTSVSFRGSTRRGSGNSRPQVSEAKRSSLGSDSSFQFAATLVNGASLMSLCPQETVELPLIGSLPESILNFDGD